MEKGSFHISSTPILATKDEIASVPLPNQLPGGIDFNELPATSLKSSALESLIHQNEDLMARLSVNLRRNHEFEDQIQNLEGENKNLRARFETIKEQYMVLQEKDRISAGHLLTLQEESSAYKKQAAKLESLYKDVFVQAQAFQGRVAKLERDQARLRKAARAVQTQAKSGRGLAEDIRSLTRTHQSSVTSYETKLSDVRQEMASLRGKIAERDRLFAEKVRLENDLIFEQRQAERHRADTQAQIDQLTAHNSQVRTELKESLITVESQRQDLTRLADEIPALKTERERLTEQVESLQALWSHKQKELEHVEEKNRALQKLNQSLSLTINQQRKDMQAAAADAEQERFQLNERIRALISEIQMLRAEKL